MAAHQAPPSLGFSRQEHWSRLPFPSPIYTSQMGSEESLRFGDLEVTDKLPCLIQARFLQCKETSFLLTCFYKNLSKHDIGKVMWGNGEVAMRFAAADYILLKVNDQLSNILCHVGMHMPTLKYSADLGKSSEMLVVNWSCQINSLSSTSSFKILENN